jgi:hypothetical protein
MSAFQTQLDIVNEACRALGIDPITLTDFQGNPFATKMGRVANQSYDKLRQSELQRNLWKFATRRANLRPITTDQLIYNVAAWNAVLTYQIGELATYLGNTYQTLDVQTDVAEIAPQGVIVAADIVTLTAAQTQLATDLTTATTDYTAANTAEGTAATAEASAATSVTTAETAETAANTAKGNVATANTAMTTPISNMSSIIATLVAQGASPTQANVNILNGYNTTFQADWTTLDGDWSTFSTDLTALASDYATASTNITTLATDFSTFSTDFATYSTAWSTVSTDWAAVSADWTALNSAWTLLASYIAQIPVMTTDAAAVAATVTTMAAIVATVAAAVTALSAAITACSTAASAVSTILTTLATDLTTLATDFTTLATDQTTVAGIVSSLVTIIGTVNSNVATLVADGASPTQAHVNTLNTNWGTFNTDWTTWGTDWGALATEWTTFTGHWTTFTGHWSTFLTDWTTFAADYATVVTDWGTFNTDWTSFGTDYTAFQAAWAALDAILGDVTPMTSGAWELFSPTPLPTTFDVVIFNPASAPYAAGTYVDYFGTVYRAINTTSDTPPTANWLALKGYVSTLTQNWVPSVWSATAAYAAFYVVQYNGQYYQATPAVQVGDIPNQAASWVRYFGVLTCQPFDPTIQYVVGEIVSFGGINYMSLLNQPPLTGSAPAQYPPNAGWLEIDGTLSTLQIMWPIGTGTLGDPTTYNVFVLPSGFLKRAPSDPKQGQQGWLGSYSGASPEDYVLEGPYLISSIEYPIMIRFVADVIDVPTMDAMFCEGLALRLALDSNEYIDQKPELKQSLLGDYKLKMGEARAVNSIEIGPVTQVENRYVTVRA